MFETIATRDISSIEKQHRKNIDEILIVMKK